jgi:sarcosine oxidase/L-pipecolate oxidase
MCWYTDSLDNSFLIDYVPDYSSTLFVASGGSGHGFKFLPVLGKHVVNALERRPDQFTCMWGWRTVEQGAHANGLEEGEGSGRDLGGLEIAETSDYVFADEVAVGKGEFGVTDRMMSVGEGKMGMKELDLMLDQIAVEA